MISYTTCARHDLFLPQHAEHPIVLYGEKPFDHDEVEEMLPRLNDALFASVNPGDRISVSLEPHQGKTQLAARTMSLDLNAPTEYVEYRVQSTNVDLTYGRGATPEEIHDKDVVRHALYQAYFNPRKKSIMHRNGKPGFDNEKARQNNVDTKIAYLLILSPHNNNPIRARVADQFIRVLSYAKAFVATTKTPEGIITTNRSRGSVTAYDAITPSSTASPVLTRTPGSLSQTSLSLRRAASSLVNLVMPERREQLPTVISDDERVEAHDEPIAQPVAARVESPILPGYDGEAELQEQPPADGFYYRPQAGGDLSAAAMPTVPSPYAAPDSKQPQHQVPGSDVAESSRIMDPGSSTQNPDEKSAHRETEIEAQETQAEEEASDAETADRSPQLPQYDQPQHEEPEADQ